MQVLNFELSNNSIQKKNVEKPKTTPINKRVQLIYLPIEFSFVSGKQCLTKLFAMSYPVLHVSFTSVRSLLKILRNNVVQ